MGPGNKKVNKTMSVFWLKPEKYTSKCEGSIIKGIKLSRSNLSNIRTLPAEVGSSSSDAMKEEKR